MSHNVNLTGVQITDLVSLRQAVEELNREGCGCRLDLDAKNFRTYRGQDTRCDAAIIMEDGSHDIGLLLQPDGTYAVRYDPYAFSQKFSVDGSAENFHGGQHDPAQDRRNLRANGWTQDEVNAATRQIGKLLQRYAICKVEREAALNGQTVTRSMGDKGVLELTVSVN